MIDCDVHNAWRSTDVLLPYLPPTFREYLERGELPGGRGSFPHAHRPWLHPEDFKRVDAVPPAVTQPAAITCSCASSCSIATRSTWRS